MEFHRPEAGLLENVVEFLEWTLYPAWLAASQALGYQVAPHIVDCADLGVPQHRVRLFLVLTRSRAPLMLNLMRERHVPAASFLDFDACRWSPIEKPGRAQATLDRVRNDRARFGDQFMMPYYGKGSGLTGRDMARPIGTITTLDLWALVRGDDMRMLSANEAMAAQSFPSDTLRPDRHRLTMHMADNTVPPLAGQRVNRSINGGSMKRIYISGPMTGLHEYNFPALAAEAERLRGLGFDVVNPAEINPEGGTFH